MVGASLLRALLLSSTLQHCATLGLSDDTSVLDVLSPLECRLRQMILTSVLRIAAGSLYTLLRARLHAIHSDQALACRGRYVRQQTPPHLNRSADTQLLPIATFWPYIANATLAELMAEHWGYAVKVGPYMSTRAVDGPACMSPVAGGGSGVNQRAFELAKAHAGQYTVSVTMSKEYLGGQDDDGNIRPEAYARDARGNFILHFEHNQYGPCCSASPEMPPSVVERMALARQLGLMHFAHAIGSEAMENAVVLNSGEYGPWSSGTSEIGDLLRDPAVGLAFAGNSSTHGSLDWQEYLMMAAAKNEGLIAAAARSAVPNRSAYLRYTANSPRDRGARGDMYRGQADDAGSYGAPFFAPYHPAQWLPQYQWPLSNFSDLPSGESYFNSGWGSGGFDYNAGGWDMLSQELNSVAQNLALGNPRFSMWLSASMPSPYDHGRKAAKYAYMGYLKVLYCAGMSAAVEQSYGSDDGWNPQEPDAAFNSTTPPAWLDHMLWHGHVRGLFSFLQDFIEDSDLLPGQHFNKFSWDLQAYEFPPKNIDGLEARNLRTVVRRRRSQPDDWLITSWLASDYNETLLARDNVVIEVPALGLLTLPSVRSCGSVYRLIGRDKTKLELLDPEPDDPTSMFGTERRAAIDHSQSPQSLHGDHAHVPAQPHHIPTTTTRATPIVGLFGSESFVNALFFRPGDPDTPRYAFAVGLASHAQAPTQPITVYYNITGGTAVQGVDYSSLDALGNVTIRAGDTWAIVRARALDNPAANGSRSICMELLPDPAGMYELDTPVSKVSSCRCLVHTLRRPSVTLAVQDVTRGEDSPRSIWTISMHPPPLVDQVVQLEFNGTAQLGTDFELPYNGEARAVVRANHYTGTVVVSAVQGTYEAWLPEPCSVVSILDTDDYDLSSGHSSGSFCVTNHPNGARTRQPYALPFPGTYDSAQMVSLHSDTVDAEILFTTDGSTPNASHGNRYTGPFRVANRTRLLAIAVSDGLNTSGLSSIGYHFAVSAPRLCYLKTAGKTELAGVVGRQNLQECIPVQVGMALSPSDRISMSSDTEGAVIRYSTDGGIPFSDQHCGYSYENSSRMYTEPVAVGSLRRGQSASLTIIAIALPSDGSQTMQSDLAVATFDITEEPVALKTDDPDLATANSGGQNDVERHVFWGSEMGGGPSFDNCTLCKRNKNLWPTILAKIDSSPTWHSPTPKSVNLTESVMDALQAGRSVPPGHKVIYVAQSFGGGNEHPADNIGSNETLSSCPGAGTKPMYFNGLWWDHGAAAVGSAWTAWLSAYISAGGSVDGVMLDMETGFSVWAFLADPHADASTVKCKQQQFDLIQADPRFPPLLEKLVAAGWNATPSTGGAHYLADAFAAGAQGISTAGYNRNMAAWLAVMTEHTNSYFAKALFEPLAAANSSAFLANYGDYQFSTDFCSMDFNGFRACDYVNMSAQSVTGTHQSSQIYGEMNNVSRSWAMPGTTTTLRRLDNISRFDFSPFNGLLLDVNFFRMSTLATGAKPNKPFFSYPSFTSGKPGTQCPWCTNVTWLGHIDYWYEAIFHLGLMGADDFFYFAPCYHVNGNQDWPNSCPNMATVTAPCNLCRRFI